MGKTSQMFLSVSKVQGLLGMSKSYCYELVAKLKMSWRRWARLSFPAKCRHNFSLRNFMVWKLRMKCWKLFTAIPAVSRQIKREGKLEAGIHYAGLTEG